MPFLFDLNEPLVSLGNVKKARVSCVNPLKIGRIVKDMEYYQFVVLLINLKNAYSIINKKQWYRKRESWHRESKENIYEQ